MTSPFQIAKASFKQHYKNQLLLIGLLVFPVMILIGNNTLVNIIAYAALLFAGLYIIDESREKEISSETFIRAAKYIGFSIAKAGLTLGCLLIVVVPTYFRWMISGYSFDAEWMILLILMVLYLLASIYATYRLMFVVIEIVHAQKGLKASVLTSLVYTKRLRKYLISSFLSYLIIATPYLILLTMVYLLMFNFALWALILGVCLTMLYAFLFHYYVACYHKIVERFDKTIDPQDQPRPL